MVDLDAVPPSAVLLAALVDPTVQLDGESEAGDLLAVIAGFERVKGYVEAWQNEAVTAYATAVDPGCAGGRPDAAERCAADRLGLALGVSGPAAAHRMRHARVLVEAMPQLSAALKAGEVSTHHARLAARAVGCLPVPVAHTADATVCATGPGGVDPDRPQWRTPAQLERALTTEIIRADPAGAAARHRTARRDRAVRFRPEPDGMTSLWSLHPAEDAALMAKTLDALAHGGHAHPAPGDTRTLDHRRADTLRDLICGTTTPTDGPDHNPTAAHTSAGVGTRRGGPRIGVTVAWSTLIGLDDAPADLTGYGPIDAHTARRIAADPTGTWLRLLVDPATGTLLEHGTTTYRPPTALRRHVTTRDHTCPQKM